MDKSKLVKCILLVIASVGLLLALTPPFLLPQPIYHAVYGWRYPKTWQCGKATITDKGPGEGIRRYIVDLGKINLNFSGTYSWDLCMLPTEERMFCGFSLEVDGYPWDQERILTKDVFASLKLYDENNKLIVEESGELGGDKDADVGNWIWSGGRHDLFIYGNTLFGAKLDSSYKLEINIETARSTSNVIADVVITGGGWK